MKALRAQYFFAYAVMGAFIPYLAVFLRQQGLDDAQIGWVQSAWGLAVLLMPVLMTLAADLHVPNCRLLLFVFLGCGAAFTVMSGLNHFWPLLIAYAIAALALTPVISLQDGLNFAEQQRRTDGGERAVPYHFVRIFGSVGYIVPSLLLYVLLRQGAPILMTMLVAAGLCGLGAINTFFLPHPKGAEPRVEKSKLNLPTLAALRTMMRPHLLVFCLAMWLCQTAVAGYYGFYPLYLTETVHVDSRWVGLIASLGVMVELPVILSFGWLLRKMGLRWLMVMCLLATVVRLVLLAGWPTVGAAIGTQLLHGPLVLIVHVIPPLYLNHCAEPQFRNSIQGLYAVGVLGLGRLVGNAVAGYVAAHGIPMLFGLDALLVLIATAMLLLSQQKWQEVRP